MKKLAIAFLIMISVSVVSFAQTSTSPKVLKKFVVEREIPGAGKLSSVELQGIASQSCITIDKMTEPVQWVQSYITDNKVYCVYLAENEEAIRTHAKLGGFPANKISEVKTIIDPTTAKK